VDAAGINLNFHQVLSSDRSRTDLKADVYSQTQRLITAEAQRVVRSFRLSHSDRADLEQIALLALWQGSASFDSGVASWATFTRRVAGNALASAMRRRCAHRRNGIEIPADGVTGSLRARHDNIDIRISVHEVLSKLSTSDRAVALSLMQQSASEASRELKISRSMLYRSIGRLRVAFSAAGFGAHRWGALAVTSLICPMHSDRSVETSSERLGPL
jgi:DNA-directed RNA polymerase specialized sigma24 family protein